MSISAIDPGVAKLQFRAKAATIFLAVFAIGSLLLDMATWAAGPMDDGEILLVGLMAILVLIGLIGSVVFVGMWINRANRNLRDHGCDDLEITPGWAVGWYFVPFANLVKPFHAMREIWNVSLYGSGAPLSESDPLLTRWWAFWILGSIISNVAFRMEGKTDLQTSVAVSAIGSLLLALAAYSLVEIMSAVTRSQVDKLGVSEVFA